MSFENKSPAMQSFLNKFTKSQFNRDIPTSKKFMMCVVCGEDASEFTDQASLDEYHISGMCQICQDETWQEWSFYDDDDEDMRHGAW